MQAIGDPYTVNRRQVNRRGTAGTARATAIGAAAFRTYSLSNQFLIAAQRPDATRVAGYRAWAKLGRQVRGGEKGIVILAPRTYKLRDEHDQETGEVRLYFRGVCAFDASQTEGDPLPEPPREPITGNTHLHLLPRLADHAATLGYTVEYADTGSTASPLVDQAANAQVRTLIHELAHALGIGYAEYGRAVAEVIVESAATIACASVGLDTSGEAVPYVAGWGDGKADTLRAFAGKVDEVASVLERACGVADVAEAVAA